MSLHDKDYDGETYRIHKDDLERAADNIVRLSQQCSRYRMALQFYADKKHFRYGNLGRDGWPECLPSEDGEIARKALADGDSK